MRRILKIAAAVGIMALILTETAYILMIDLEGRCSACKKDAVGTLFQDMTDYINANQQGIQINVTNDNLICSTESVLSGFNKP